MSETQLSPEMQGRHAGPSKNMEVPPSLITITLSGNKRNVSPEDSNNGVRSPTCEEKAMTPFTPSVISEEDQLNRKARLFNLERDLPQSIQVNCNQHVETDNISSVDMSFCESLHWHIDNSTPDFVVQEAIRQCIKQKVFRLLKFCDRDIHGCFNESSKSVCGIVLKFCNLKKAAIAREKWIELRPMVMRAHATHRNNCIKSLQKRYKESIYSKERLLTSSDDMVNILALRRNTMDYVQFMDTFVPCIVGVSVWNDRLRVESACSRGDNAAFRELFSVSDETFMLASFINSIDRWSAEVERDSKKKLNAWTENDEANMPASKYTCKGRGRGWSDEGIDKFNEIFALVKADRVKNGESFNKALWEWYQCRRCKPKATKPCGRKRQVHAFSDFDDLSMHASPVKSHKVRNQRRKLQADIGHDQARSSVASDWDEYM